MHHLFYLIYVLKHKWFTFLVCRRIPLLGILHDCSRFLPDEWFPRAKFLFSGKERRDSTGYYDSAENEEYQFSWFLHQKRNKHHWQYWTLPKDNGSFVCLPMPSKYRREMLADMRGAARAQNKPSIVPYYNVNKDKMHLHPETRKWLEQEILE